MTPNQKRFIENLCKHNGILNEELDRFVQKKFGKKIEELNTREANRIIEILEEEPDEIFED